MESDFIGWMRVAGLSVESSFYPFDLCEIRVLRKVKRRDGRLVRWMERHLPPDSTFTIFEAFSQIRCSSESGFCAHFLK